MSDKIKNETAPVKPDAKAPAAPAADPAKEIKVKARLDTLINGVLLKKGMEMTVSEHTFAALGARLVKLGCILAAALLLLCVIARAADPGQYGITLIGTTNGASSALAFNGGTNTIAASATTTNNSYFTLTKYGDVGFYIGVGSGLSNIVLNFSESMDGTNWMVGTKSIALGSAAGTAGNVFNTNWTLNTVGYIKLHYYVTTNPAVLTNVIMGWVQKPWRYGTK